MKTKIVRTLAVTIAAISLLSVAAYAKDYNTSGTSGYQDRILDGTEGEGSATVLRGGVDRITATDEWAVPNTIIVTYKYDNNEETDPSFPVRTSFLGFNTYYHYTVKTKGTYEYWKVTHTHADLTWTNRYITLEPNNPTVSTAPAVKNPKYTGEPQELISAGVVENGTIYYSLDNQTWSTDIPTATNEGNYTVYYKITGDEGYNDIGATSINSTISQPTPASAAYTNMGDFGEGTDRASAWSVMLLPGDIAIDSIDVMVNDTPSKEGAWSDSPVFSGAVLIMFGVAVNTAADNVESLTAVVNGNPIQTMRVN